MSTSCSNDPSGPSTSESSDESQSESDATPVVLTHDTQMRVFVDEETGENSFRMLSKSKWAAETQITTELLDFLAELQEKILPHATTNYLPTHTRHVRDKQIFREHPNFRGQGPWRDWAVIDWGPGHGNLPGHINCFVEIEDLPAGPQHGGAGLKKVVCAVVESSLKEEDEVELAKSDPFVPCYKQVDDLDSDIPRRVFYLADTEAFMSPCAMVPDIGGPKNRHFWVKPRTQWNKEFIHWVESAHADDDVTEET